MSTSRPGGVLRSAAGCRRPVDRVGVRHRRGAAALALAAMALGFGGAACAKARAETVPDGPPLLVPAPPPRVLAPVEARAIPEAVPEPDPAPAVAVPTAEAAPPVTESRPRPRPAAAAPAVPEVPGAVGGAGDLRAGSASTATQSSVRGMLARAARDRARVNVNQLSAAARSQYRQSQRFTAQAQQALRDRNLIFAAALAEKAAALALELVGR